MPIMFHSHKSIIDAWPDLQAFAGDIQATYDAAKQMRRRESIPSEYWADVVAGAGKRGIDGVSLERLAEIAASRRTTKSAKPETEEAA